MAAGPPARTGWTPQQRDAIHADGVSVALSAGAGCGKTTVLTERFLHCLEAEELPLARLVALTFTEKAARELRARVRLACRKRADQGGTDAGYWRAVLRGLEAAPIGTFHSFCAQILRRFPIEAGVEPGFAILEESLAPTVRDRTLLHCSRRWLESRDPDYIALAAEFGSDDVSRLIGRLIGLRARADVESWGTATPEQVLARWDAAWFECQGRVLRDRLQPALESVEGLASEAGSLPEAFREKVSTILDLSRRLAMPGDPVENLSEMRATAMMKGGPGKSAWSNLALKDRTLETFKTLRTAIDILLKNWVAADPDVTAEAARQGLRLARLTQQALGAYADAKRETGLLDFEDLQLRTRDLLRRQAPEVVRWIETGISRILVDEFQDTDPVQGEIIQLLAQGTMSGGRVFLVGDGKQSIYRFRGAQPGIFEEFQGGMDDGGRKRLSVNFRSVPGIIAFVNHLFGGSFAGGGHDLQSSSGVVDHAEAHVEFLWPPASDERRPAAADRRRQEARSIASHVRDSLDQRRWMVRTGAGGGLRPATAGDVVMLFRTLNDAAEYEMALSRAGLDFHVVKGAAFFGQQEVLDVINLLTVLEDPYQEVALAATLRSPFGCVSDAGLFRLARSELGGLAEGFATWQAVRGLSAADRARVDRLSRLLAEWRRRKDAEPIAALLDRILDESGYEAALPAEFLGDRRRANLRKLVRLAGRFDRNGGFTLADFTSRLRDHYQDPPREPQAATTDEEGEAVRLMTIHQAKGLEFPVVVLPDLDRAENPNRARVALEPDLGVVLRGSADDSTTEDTENPRCLGWMIHEAREWIEDREESCRLFYVATTRAKDFLVLSAGLPPADRPRSIALKLLDRRFNRETGEPRDGTDHQPAVRVVRPAPTESKADRPRTHRRGLIQVAWQIRHPTQPTKQAEAARPLPRPRSLALEPWCGLNPRESRIDRLLRSSLQDPELFRSEPIRLIDRALKVSCDPTDATVRLAAAERLAEWLRGDEARWIARAGQRAAPTPWIVAWPPEDREPMVISGQADLLLRDDADNSHLVIVSNPRAPERREQLRGALSLWVESEESPNAAFRVRWSDWSGAARNQEDRPVNPGALRDQIATLLDGE